MSTKKNVKRVIVVLANISYITYEMNHLCELDGRAQVIQVSGLRTFQVAPLFDHRIIITNLPMIDIYNNVHVYYSLYIYGES